MNDTTRDELRETIAGIIEGYGYQCINTERGYHESPDEEPIATEIISLVTEARDAEIREALLSDKTVKAAAVEWLGTPLKGDLEHMNRILNCAAVYIGLDGDGTGGQG